MQAQTYQKLQTAYKKEESYTSKRIGVILVTDLNMARHKNASAHQVHLRQDHAMQHLTNPPLVYGQMHTF
ncbi:UNVERIFIED_CONTAM: hypothetical protein FKN15_045769 [Acipenser sinensis]